MSTIIETVDGEVTVIERTNQSVMLRGPQMPQIDVSELPESLRELLRPRVGDARERQAEDILVYMQGISQHLDILFRNLVYCIGEIKRQQLFREIGAAAGIDHPINNIEQLCTDVLGIDPKLAKDAETTYESVTPFLHEIGMPTNDVFTRVTPRMAVDLKNLATQAKAQQKGRRGGLPEETKEEFQEEVERVLAGGRPSSQYARGRREEIEPTVIGWDWEIIEPDDSEPYIRPRVRNMYMKDLIAIKAHRAGWQPYNLDGTDYTEIDQIIVAMDQAFLRLAERKEIF